jgi:hypothetical protein
MNNQIELQHSAPAFVDIDFALPGMHELILDYLATNNPATFVELEEDVPGFSGELPLKAVSNRNTILWQGLSAAAIHALYEMEKQGEIQFQETSCDKYQHRGRRLYLPVAGWEADRTHWTPVLVTLRVQTH